MSQRFNILNITLFMTILNNRVEMGKIRCPRIRKNIDFAGSLYMLYSLHMLRDCQ